MSKLKIIVTGMIGQYPLGGVSWDYIQYVAGLKLLGHDVYYVEDTGQYPFNPLEGGIAKECDFNVRYLQEVMGRFGMEERWAYHFPWKSQWYGLADNNREEVICSADILINVSGSLAYPEKYRHIPCLVYIDSDPVFTQAKLAKGQGFMADYISEIMHRMRDRNYAPIITENVCFGDMSQRNQRSLVRVGSGLLKLMFPHRTAKTVTPAELKIVLDVAIDLRQRVVDQLAIILPGEFSGIKLSYKIKGE